MKALLTLFVLFLHTPAFAGGASDAGNGGGIAEKNVLFAREHLESFIDLCLETSLCQTDASENDLLKKIKATLYPEKTSQIDFRSGKKDPDFFKIEGLVRVAKTGDHVGDPIYINQDLLYSTLASGEVVSVNVPLAVSILIHEFGHHHDVKDHNALDRLGLKLQTLLLQHEERSEFWNGNADLVVYQFNSVRHDEDKKKISQLDQIVLENRSEIYMLTPKLAEQLKCAAKSDHHGIRIYNLHSERGIRFDQATQLLTKPMAGWYIQSCESGKETDHGDFRINLVFKKIAEENFEYLPEKTTITVLSCKKHPESCK